MVCLKFELILNYINASLIQFNTLFYHHILYIYNQLRAILMVNGEAFFSSDYWRAWGSMEYPPRERVVQESRGPPPGTSYKIILAKSSF